MKDSPTYDEWLQRFHDAVAQTAGTLEIPLEEYAARPFQLQERVRTEVLGFKDRLTFAEKAEKEAHLYAHDLAVQRNQARDERDRVLAALRDLQEKYKDWQPGGDPVDPKPGAGADPDPPHVDPPQVDPTDPTDPGSNPGGDPLGPLDDAAEIHAFATRTAVENKPVFIDEIRSKRQGRTPQQLRDPNGGANIMARSAKKLGVIGNLALFGGYIHAVSVAKNIRHLYHPDGSPVLEPRGDGRPGTFHAYEFIPGNMGQAGLVNCSIAPTPNGRAATEMKWGLRGSDWGDELILIDCDWSDIPVEHAHYNATAGDVFVEGNTYRNIAGNCDYTVQRHKSWQQYGANNRIPTRSVRHVHSGGHMRDCGVGGGKGGYLITKFNPGTSEFPAVVEIVDTTSVQCWDFERAASPGNRDTFAPGTAPANIYQPIRSTAFFMLHAYPEGQTLDIFGHQVSLLRFERVALDYTQSSMALAVVRGARVIDVEDCCWLARDGGPGLNGESADRRRFLQPIMKVDDRLIEGLDTAEVIRFTNTIALHLDENGNVVKPIMCQYRDGKGNIRSESMHCPGERVEIDCQTGQVTRRALTSVNEFDADDLDPIGGLEIDPMQLAPAATS